MPTTSRHPYPRLTRPQEYGSSSGAHWFFWESGAACWACCIILNDTHRAGLLLRRGEGGCTAGWRMGEGHGPQPLTWRPPGLLPSICPGKWGTQVLGSWLDSKPPQIQVMLPRTALWSLSPHLWWSGAQTWVGSCEPVFSMLVQLKGGRGRDPGAGGQPGREEEHVGAFQATYAPFSGVCPKAGCKLQTSLEAGGLSRGQPLREAM